MESFERKRPFGDCRRAVSYTLIFMSRSARWCRWHGLVRGRLLGILSARGGLGALSGIGGGLLLAVLAALVGLAALRLAEVRAGLLDGALVS